jgi:TonB family protein
VSTTARIVVAGVLLVTVVALADEPHSAPVNPVADEPHGTLADPFDDQPHGTLVEPFAEKPKPKTLTPAEAEALLGRAAKWTPDERAAMNAYVQALWDNEPTSKRKKTKLAASLRKALPASSKVVIVQGPSYFNCLSGECHYIDGVQETDAVYDPAADLCVDLTGRKEAIDRVLDYGVICGSDPNCGKDPTTLKRGKESELLGYEIQVCNWDAWQLYGSALRDAGHRCYKYEVMAQQYRVARAISNVNTVEAWRSRCEELVQQGMSFDEAAAKIKEEETARADARKVVPSKAASQPAQGPTEPAVSDTLTPKMIKHGVRSVLPRLRKCNEQSAADDTDVKLRLVVDPDGSVTNAKVLRAADPALGSCVVAAIRRTTFEQTQRGGVFSYTVSSDTFDEFTNADIQGISVKPATP